MPIELEVKGHSGCDIDVIREDSRLYILKSSRDPKYLARLVRQAEKQRAAASDELQHIRVPRIHNIEHDDSHVAVKMDYVYSRNFVEYFEQAGFEQVNYLIDALIMYLEHEISQSVLTTVDRAVVADKFEDVVSHILDNPHLKDIAGIPAMIDRSKKVFDALPDMTMPVGICHGDLTFSNILFNGNNYFLIDFLDSFIESPLLDIVKLRQDTAWMWSRLMYSGDCDEIRLRIVIGKIDAAIDAHFREHHGWYADYYAPLQLMNFLRILQYAHDPRVITYLINSITSQLDQCNG